MTEREAAAASEREAFEAWAVPRCLHLPKRPDGEYASVTTQETWEAWQARASLSRAAQPVRVPLNVGVLYRLWAEAHEEKGLPGWKYMERFARAIEAAHGIVPLATQEEV
jgi:hypothetical protein